MLNRRILRVKVMQAVYSYLQIERATYDNARELIAAAFTPDLESMTPIHPDMLEGLTRLANAQFEEVYHNATPSPRSADMPDAAWKAAEEARVFYQSHLAKERIRVLETAVAQAQEIYGTYAAVLMLLPALGRQVMRNETELQNRFIKPAPAPTHTLKLARNPVLDRLDGFRPLHDLAVRHGVDWDKNHKPLIKQIFEEDLQGNETYQAYAELGEADYKAHYEQALYLVRHVILKSSTVDHFFAEEDLHWAENKEVVKNMVVRTIKSLEDPNGEPELTLLSTDWEDDKDFMQTLFRQTLAHTSEYEEFVSAHTPNWAFSRLAATDRIILMLALTEFQFLPSVPRKVTINEYIEVAKLYSTPQSKQFINGVLDTLADQLAKEGKLRKSGRGMIEN